MIISYYHQVQYALGNSLQHVFSAQALRDLSFIHPVGLPSWGPLFLAVQMGDRESTSEHLSRIRLECGNITCTLLLLAATQSPDPSLTSWEVFESVVLKKWKI